MKTHCKKLYMVATGALCSLVMNQSTMAQESANLSLKFKPGMTYHNSQKMEMSMLMGPGRTMNTSMVMATKGMAKKHDKGVALNVSYDYMTMASSMNQQLLVEFDSRKENQNKDVAKAMKPVLAMKFSAIYNDKGDFVGSEGLDKLKLPADSGVSKESIEAMLKQAVLLLPNREVKVGESWISKMSIPMQGLGNMELEFNELLKSIDTVDGKKLAKIMLTGKMAPMEVNQNGQMLKISAKEIDGHMLYDIEEKQIKMTKMNMELNLEAAGQVMVMTMSNIQELTKVEKTK